MRHTGWMRQTLLLLAVTAGLLAAPLCHAQEKHAFEYKLPASSGKYPQQYRVEVGDVPGHFIRIFEVERTFPEGTLPIDGVPVVRGRNFGFSDYIDINGPNWGYGAWELADGDTIFFRFNATSQNTKRADGSEDRVSVAVATLTRGTGKFRGIHGMARNVVHFDPSAGHLDAESRGEYWMER